MLTSWSNHTCVLSEKDRKGWADLIVGMKVKLGAILRAAEDGKQAIMRAAGLTARMPSAARTEP